MGYLDLNWWAVLVATIMGFVLGGLWYGPLFGQAWMTAIGKTEEEIVPTPAPFVISFFTAGITAIGIAILVQQFAISTLIGGLGVGAFVGICFIATAMASDTAFCGWGAKLFFIQSGYRVAYSIIMGGILAVWS